MKTYRMLIEYWVPDEDENLFEEKIIQSRSSCGKIVDDYLAQDRTNLIRSVEVTPVWIMNLSTESVSKIADALKPAVINYIYEDEGYVEYMQTAVVEGIRKTMGDMDEDLLFELGMLIFDRIELKWWLKHK